MRRIKLILAVVASMAVMMTVAAAPAMAAVRITNNGNHDFFIDNGNRDFFFNGNNNGVFNEVANEDETGNVDLSFSVESTGNNSNQCVTPLQFGNTGSNQNAQGFFQFASFADDLEGTGGDFTFAPVLSSGCDQAVQQSSAASSF